MQDLGWEVWKDVFDEQTPHGVKTFTNVIAEQDANAPRKLTLACHHDSKYFSSGVFIGVYSKCLMDVTATALVTSFSLLKAAVRKQIVTVCQPAFFIDKRHKTNVAIVTSTTLIVNFHQQNTICETRNFSLKPLISKYSKHCCRF